VAPIFGATPLYIKKDKKWQMPLIMRLALGSSFMVVSIIFLVIFCHVAPLMKWHNLG
jgi:hypothetical protein